MFYILSTVRYRQIYNCYNLQMSWSFYQYIMTFIGSFCNFLFSLVYLIYWVQLTFNFGTCGIWFKLLLAFRHFVSLPVKFLIHLAHCWLSLLFLFSFFFSHYPHPPLSQTLIFTVTECNLFTFKFIINMLQPVPVI